MRNGTDEIKTHPWRGTDRRRFLTALATAVAAGAVGCAHSGEERPAAKSLRTLAPVDLGFLETAPFRVVSSGVLPASVQRVFEVLGAPEPWPQWFPTIERIAYLTPAPFGVGTERDAITAYGTIREHFLVWEPGRRIAFYVRETDMPGLIAFMEDYVLEEVAPQKTRLVWTVVYDLAPWARLGHPLAKPALDGTFADGVESLARWLEAHPA